MSEGLPDGWVETPGGTWWLASGIQRWVVHDWYDGTCEVHIYGIPGIATEMKQRVEAAVLALRGETRLPDWVVGILWDYFAGDNAGDITEYTVRRFRMFIHNVALTNTAGLQELLAEYREQEAEE